MKDMSDNLPLKVGRPSKFKHEFIEVASKAIALGATHAELAQQFQVDANTITDWIKSYPEFGRAIKNAKYHIDQTVVDALHKSATGFIRRYQEITKDGEVVEAEEQLPPNAAAMIFWLKNRQPDRWRDKRELEHSGSIDLRAVIQDGDQCIDITPSQEEKEELE